jgi:hypothetical protein
MSDPGSVAGIVVMLVISYLILTQLVGPIRTGAGRKRRAVRRRRTVRR